jgi:hypothetical protein
MLSTRDRAPRSVHGHRLPGVIHHLLGKVLQHGGVIPIHPVAQANGLSALNSRVLQHPGLAQLHEIGHAEGLNVALALEAEFLLDLHLHPQALTVKALLVAHLTPAHGPEAVPQVLVGAPPAVVDTHGVVGGDGAINEAPVGLALVLGP